MFNFPCLSNDTLNTAAPKELIKHCHDRLAHCNTVTTHNKSHYQNNY